jgi:exonuclease VII large subunit
MVQGGEGEVLRSVDQVQPGDKIKISVSDGEIEAAVTNVKENSHE